MRFGDWVGRLRSAMTSSPARRRAARGVAADAANPDVPAGGASDRAAFTHGANLDDVIALVHESDSVPLFGAGPAKAGPDTGVGTN